MFFVRSFCFALFWAFQVDSEFLELRWFVLVLACLVLGRFSSSVCIWLFEFVILTFIVFINFKKLRCVRNVFLPSFYKLWTGFTDFFDVVLVASTSVDGFRIMRLFQIVEISFRFSSLCVLFHLVFGCCGLWVVLGCCR